MRRSPIIRVSVVILFVGVGLWCVVVLPALFSQEGAFSQASPSRPAFVQSGPAGYPTSPGAPEGVPMGAAPSAGNVDVGGGIPSGINSDAGLGDFTTEPELGSAGGAPSALPPGGSMPPGMGMGGPMSGMMGGPGMSRAQLEEMNLARHAKVLLSRYAKAQKPELKDKIKTELRSVLHQQFRLQHQRRDAELAQVERRLADLRSRLKKRGDAQSTIVDRRLEQLVNDVDGLGWSADEVPDNLFNEGSAGSMLMQRMGSGMGGYPQPGPPGSTGAGGAPVFNDSAEEAGLPGYVPSTETVSPPPADDFGSPAPVVPRGEDLVPPPGPTGALPPGAPGTTPGLPPLQKDPDSPIPPGTGPVPGTPPGATGSPQVPAAEVPPGIPSIPGGPGSN